jgi:hemolysin D
MLKRFFNKDDSHEFKPMLVEIEERPVSPLGRATFWIIIAIILFTSLWMIFGMVDIVIAARGKVIPDGEIKILQPLETGVVSSILVKEGDFVKKGQVLMEIDPSSTQPELESMQQNLSQIELEKKRLKAVSGQGGSVGSNGSAESVRTQRELYSASMNSLNSQLAAKQMELNRVEEQAKTALSEIRQYKTLLNTSILKEKRLKTVSDIIAKDDYDKAQNEATSYRTSLQSSTYKLSELNQQKRQILEEIGYIRQNFKETNLKELSDREKQATQLDAQIQQVTFKNTKQKIVSPVDGHINSLLIHTEGGVVTPAEKLISIVPVNSPLVIKATVLNKDIGFVKKDMPVQIKIDTFDFQKYGMIKGKVKMVSKNSIDDQKLGPIYEVYITPVDKSLKIEGKNQNISTGMSLSAEIKVGKRRIIEFFIYPLVKYWNEGISVR